MSGPWASVSDYAWVDGWREFLRAAEYEAEMRGGSFDVWTALAEAVHTWLDHYEGVEQTSVADTGHDALRSAMRRLCSTVPDVGVPGGQSVGSVLAASMGARVRVCNEMIGARPNSSPAAATTTEVRPVADAPDEAI